MHKKAFNPLLSAVLKLKYNLTSADAEFLEYKYAEVYEGDELWGLLKENEREYMMDWRLGIGVFRRRGQIRWTIIAREMMKQMGAART